MGQPHPHSNDGSVDNGVTQVTSWVTSISTSAQTEQVITTTSWNTSYSTDIVVQTDIATSVPYTSWVTVRGTQYWGSPVAGRNNYWDTEVTTSLFTNTAYTEDDTKQTTTAPFTTAWTTQTTVTTTMPVSTWVTSVGTQYWVGGRNSYWNTDRETSSMTNTSWSSNVERQTTGDSGTVRATAHGTEVNTTSTWTTDVVTTTTVNTTLSTVVTTSGTTDWSTSRTTSRDTII
jgi:hypothetical protein